MLIMIISILAFLFWISGEKQKNGIHLYFANIGTGKTTYLSKIAIKELKRIEKGKSKYKHILSNALIAGVTYEPNIRKLIKQGAIQHTLILIDEGSIVYNNRKQVMTEQEIFYFKMIRHYTSNCIVVSQSYDDIDVTLRRLYSSIYLLTYMPLFTLIRPIKKRVGIDEVTKQIIDEYKFKWPFSWRVFLRPKYFKYFNSWWIPDDVDIIDMDILKKQPKYEKKKRSLGFITDKKMREEYKVKPQECEGNVPQDIEEKTPELGACILERAPEKFFL